MIFVLQPNDENTWICVLGRATICRIELSIVSLVKKEGSDFEFPEKNIEMNFDSH